MTIFEYLSEQGLQLVQVRETYDKRNGKWLYSALCKDKTGKQKQISIDGEYLRNRDKLLK